MKKSKKPAQLVRVDTVKDLGALIGARRRQLESYPFSQKYPRDRELSRTNFAGKVGLERTAYYRVEDGASWPRFSNLKRIFDELELELVIRPKAGAAELPAAPKGPAPAKPGRS